MTVWVTLRLVSFCALASQVTLEPIGLGRQRQDDVSRRERAERVSQRLERLVATDSAACRNAAAAQPPDRLVEAFLGGAMLRDLVLGEKVQTGDPRRHDDMNGDVLDQVPADHLHQRLDVAARVGDDQ